jgi:hypothetical protein
MLRSAALADTSWETDPQEGNFAFVFYWPKSRHEFAVRIWDLAELIAPSGALWVMFPKKAYLEKVGLDMSWEEMQAAALETVLVDNKVAAFSEEYYATRFVIRRNLRGGPRQ